MRKLAMAQILLLLLLLGPLLTLLNLFSERKGCPGCLKVQRGKPAVFDQAVVIVFAEARFTGVLIYLCWIRAVRHTAWLFVVESEHSLSWDTFAFTVLH